MQVVLTLFSVALVFKAFSLAVNSVSSLVKTIKKKNK